MKKLVLLCLMLLGATVTFAQNSAKNDKAATSKPKKEEVKAPEAKAKGPAISFETDMHDFGKIEKGQIAKVKFKFTNTGDQPLIITNVRPSCGCTTPTYSKEPVLPGQTGYIEAAYNSNVGHGTFTKSISVTTNIPDQTSILFIKGEVIENPADNPATKSPVRTGN